MAKKSEHEIGSRGRTNGHNGRSKSAFKILIGKPPGKKSLGRPRRIRKLKYIKEMNLNMIKLIRLNIVIIEGSL